MGLNSSWYHHTREGRSITLCLCDTLLKSIRQLNENGQSDCLKVFSNYANLDLFVVYLLSQTVLSMQAHVAIQQCMNHIQNNS